MTRAAERSTPVPDHVGYPAVRRSIRTLLAERPEAGARPVPSCPEWTVTDLLAHLVAIAGRVLLRHGVTPWASRAEPDVPGLLDHWDDLGAEVDRRLAAAGGRSGEVLVMDAFTHELDLRAALGAPPPTGHVAWGPSFEVLIRGFSGAITGLGLPALRLRTTDGGRWTAGPGTPAVSVTASPHELCRALAGRRSLAQLTALDWSAPAGPWLPAFTWGPFAPPAEPGH